MVSRRIDKIYSLVGAFVHVDSRSLTLHPTGGPPHDTFQLKRSNVGLIIAVERSRFWLLINGHLGWREHEGNGELPHWIEFL